MKKINKRVSPLPPFFTLICLFHYFPVSMKMRTKNKRLFVEIWTDVSLNPKEHLREASPNLINLFVPLLYKEEKTYL